jgi:hypothetical protein
MHLACHVVGVRRIMEAVRPSHVIALLCVWTAIAGVACAPSTAEHPAGAAAPAAVASFVAVSAATPAPRAAGTFDHALLVSVDGLRSDALRAVPASELPNFRRLMNGAATLNARTDPDYTVTLPNHTDMFTGRPVLGPQGHGWIKNDDAEPGETIHKNHGAYVASVFDVAHDHGFHTALFAGKSKFALYDASYDGEAGRKIDAWKFAKSTEEIADLVLAHLGAGGQRSLVFAHYAITDLTGHASGWDVTPRSRYMQAVAAVDKEIGRILDAIEASAALRGKTVVVVTTDHGGGAPLKSHDQTQMWVDYIIPFFVWTGDPPSAQGGTDAKPLDLYALNTATRADPGIASPRLDAAGRPPIRNGDAGNLLLSLLGLPAVPDSTFDREQDLKVR